VSKPTANRIAIAITISMFPLSYKRKMGGESRSAVKYNNHLVPRGTIRIKSNKTKLINRSVTTMSAGIAWSVNG